MNFFEKNRFPLNTNLTLESKEYIEGKSLMFIRTKEQVIIGCGIYDPSIDKDFYDLYCKFPIENILLNELIQNKGFVFLVTDNHFYSASISLINPVSRKKTSISELQEEISNVFKK